MTSALAVAIGSQQPRLHLVPPYISSAGRDAIEVAALAGLVLDPWEQLVITDALAENDRGRWAAYRVGLEVPRQNGKGTILEARELAGLFTLGEKLIIHSAHEQATASEHFRRMLNLMEGVPEFDRRILKVVRGKGTEAIELRDGYRIFFKTRTGGGGRGFTGNLVVFDEAMILAAAFMAALVPTMAAQSIDGDPQLWFAGSAVDQQKTEHGTEFARVRADALAGVERLAYFGWNLPYDSPDEVPDEVLDDPAAWAQANPGLGIRISPQYVGDERHALGRREFAVERLGIGDWPDLESPQGTLDFEQFAALFDAQSIASGPVCFAWDVNPERTGAAIAVAGWRDDGNVHLEVVDRRPGTEWVAGRMSELTQKHPSLPSRCDQRGPAASLLGEVRNASVTVEPMNSSELVQGCGLFFDGVEQATFRHCGAEEHVKALADAVRGAKKRPLGDAWAWSRKSSTVDISPLVACTLALWGTVQAGRPGGGFEW